MASKSIIAESNPYWHTYSYEDAVSILSDILATKVAEIKEELKIDGLKNNALSRLIKDINLNNLVGTYEFIMNSSEEEILDPFRIMVGTFICVAAQKIKKDNPYLVQRLQYLLNFCKDARISGCNEPYLREEDELGIAGKLIENKLNKIITPIVESHPLTGLIPKLTCSEDLRILMITKEPKKKEMPEIYNILCAYSLIEETPKEKEEYEALNLFLELVSTIKSLIRLGLHRIGTPRYQEYEYKFGREGDVIYFDHSSDPTYFI